MSTNNIIGTKTAALYIRVSTNMQEELSPDAQKRLLMEYAHKNDIIISNDQIYIENGISGRKADKRPEFQRMIGTAKQNPCPFDVILVWKFSRFARNQEESIVYKSLLKKQCGVDVISVSEPIIDGPFGSLIERIIEWMDEYYSTRLSGEVFRGMSEKALRGGYQARPPLGYKIEKHGEPPVVVQEEAIIVRTIFDLYVNQGKSLFEITRHLNAIGYKTSHNKPFEKRSVEYLIQNPTYIGKIRWNRTENATNRIKDQDEWIVADGTHEAIISKDLFDAAQERYRSEYHRKGARPAAYQKHWLSGLLKCSACGRSLSCSTQRIGKDGTEYRSFNCYGYLKGKCGISHSIPAHKAEKAVLDIIHRDILSGNICFVPVERKTDHTEHDILINQLASVSKKEQRIKQAYRDGIDTIEEYRENKLIIEREKAALEKQISNIEKTQSAAVSEESAVERLRSVYDVLISDHFTYQQKGEAVKSIVSKIVYDKDENTMQVYYYSR